jgi:ParB-like chromosome segregation protein Spo0J
MDDAEALEFLIAENLQREDLNAVDEARLAELKTLAQETAEDADQALQAASSSALSVLPL